jgi:hypothetical protein
MCTLLAVKLPLLLLSQHGLCRGKACYATILDLILGTMQILNHIWKNTQRSTTKLKRRGDRFHKNQKIIHAEESEGRRKKERSGDRT